MNTRYAVLLRGINVGRGNRIAMADWRQLLERDGFLRVRTVLASGNAVFELPKKTSTAKMATTIAESLEREHGIKTRATVLSAAELQSIAQENPLLDVADNPSRLLVCVPASKADYSVLKKLAERTWPGERFEVGSAAGYAWLPDSVIDSAVFAELQRALGPACTTRNWSTWQKLVALCND